MSRRYAFYALTPEGRLVHRVVEAESAVAARELAAREDGGSVRELDGSLLARLKAALLRPDRASVATAARQLASLLEAGVPFLQSIATVASQAHSRRLREILEQIGEDVAAGGEIAAACGRFPGIFEEVAVGLLSAAEADGRLSEAFTEIADDCERVAADRRELVSSVFYPAVCMAVAIVMTIYLGATFMPRVAELYQSFELPVPPSVAAFASASAFLARFGLAIAMAIGGIVGLVVLARLNERIRELEDGLLLRIPLLGNIVRAAATARFTGTFGRLHERGIPIVRALEITAGVVGNRVIRRAIARVQAEVQTGHALAAAMDRTRCFSPIGVSMAAVGEASGALGTLLLRAEKACREEWRFGTRRLMSTIRPFLLVIVSLAVLFLLTSLYTPLLEILPRVSGV